MPTSTRPRRGQALAAGGRTLLRLALLALGNTLVVELFNHKAFTDGPGSFWTFLTGAPLAFAGGCAAGAGIADSRPVSAQAGVLVYADFHRVAGGRARSTASFCSTA